MLKSLLTAVNFFSTISGIHAIRYALPMASNSDETTLCLLGYRQTDTYSCGAAAGYAIVARFNPSVTYDDFFDKVRPEMLEGVDTNKLMRGLRKFGVNCSLKETLDFVELVKTIDAGHPIIAGRLTEFGVDHWVVLYGYGKNPERVFVMGRSANPLLPEEMLWKAFKESFDAVNGPAITCWGDKARGSKLQRLRLSNPNQQ